MKSKQNLIILAIPFGIIMISLLFIPNEPIWDERLFFPTVKVFGENYFPSVHDIQNMFSPMGPVYFTIWGFLGKLLSFNLLWMRAIHVVLAYFFIRILNRLLQEYSLVPIWAVMVFILNPYFWVMTAPLLYTDITALFFTFCGIFFYLIKENRFFSGICLGLAICTRQLLIVIPIALFLTDLYYMWREKISWKNMSLNLIPFSMFIPLFVLWGFNVNSGSFGSSGPFQENTLEAFQFSFKKVNYSLILIGLYLVPFIKSWWPKSLDLTTLIVPFVASPMLLLGFSK